jgi:large subunit ribosomal protein L25
MTKLTIFPRKSLSKGETNKLRREGNVPGILYGRGQANDPIYLKGEEVQAVLRTAKGGTLATTVFELHDGKKAHRAILKDIQYHPASYAVQHVDFVTLDDNQPITVSVPIRVTGAADCPGVKLGGFLRQVIRTLKVSCLPNQIPSEFVLDVSQLEIAGSKRLLDIAIPDGVRPLGRMNEVAVVIAKSKAS